ncbi:hypothetical protein HKX48_006398 [Thoreauomyces humboldtii]|nr:hypothetical protein HKX48_006398 [Thoreauomyces humboldtii]
MNREKEKLEDTPATGSKSKKKASQRSKASTAAKDAPPSVKSATSPSLQASPAPPDSTASRTNSSEKTTGKVNHVCFVVHGMGRQRRYVQNMASLRRACAEVGKEEFSGQEDVRVEWIPIEWHEELHELHSVDRRMNSITLPTCSILRAINNDILADVLYYFSSFHGQTILNIIAQRLNKAYHDFMEANPDFDGQINLIGHSLGGVICYDLLANLDPSRPPRGPSDRTPVSAEPPRPHFEISYPQLAFRPGALFTLGSPVGAVLIMRGQSLTKYRPPRDILFHNLFHLYDPLCYRVEPLLDAKYQGVPPILLQRPSARNSNFAYYRELISSYLPDMPTMASMPQLPRPNLSLGMSMANLQIPPLDTLRANMAGVMESMYASVWTAGGFWDDYDETDLQGSEHELEESSDDADGSWPPRKRARLSFGGASSVPTERAADAPSPAEQSHKRKRRHSTTSSESRQTLRGREPRPIAHLRHRSPTPVTSIAGTPSSPVAGATESSAALATSLKPALSYVSTLTGGVSGSVSSMADKVYKSLFSPPNPQAPSKDETSPSPRSVTTTFVDELVGRDEAERLVENDMHNRAEASSDGASSPRPAVSSEAGTATATVIPPPLSPPCDPPPIRLDFYVQDNIIDNVFQQYLTGLKAHFSYWSNKNVMYHIMKYTLQRHAGQSLDAGHWGSS